MSMKSILEALAEVQRKVNEQKTKNAEANWSQVSEGRGSAPAKQPAAPETERGLFMGGPGEPAIKFSRPKQTDSATPAAPAAPKADMAAGRAAERSVPVAASSAPDTNRTTMAPPRPSQTPRPNAPAPKPAAAAAPKDDIWDNSKLSRTGPGGEETAADFQRNSEIYKQRAAAGGQPPAPTASAAPKPAAPKPAAPASAPKTSSVPAPTAPTGPAKVLPPAAASVGAPKPAAPAPETGSKNDRLPSDATGSSQDTSNAPKKTEYGLFQGGKGEAAIKFSREVPDVPKTQADVAKPAPAAAPEKVGAALNTATSPDASTVEKNKAATAAGLSGDEDGGKSKGKKKMSESVLVNAFLKLQESKSENMFEAAKKAKKDYDGDGKVESEKDEVWGSRFKAAKKAGKMEEGKVPDNWEENTPATRKKTVNKHLAAEKVPGSKNLKMEEGAAVIVAGANNKRAAAETDRKKQEDDKSAAAAMDKRDLPSQQQEEKSIFSEAELAHLASFEEAVAPQTDKDSADVNQAPSSSILDEAGKRGRPSKKDKEAEDPNAGNGRDPRQHIQVIAGQAGAGRVMDFKHNDGSVSKITPPMGRAITAKLNGMKPADRHAAVNKMHDSAEGLKG